MTMISGGIPPHISIVVPAPRAVRVIEYPDVGLEVVVEDPIEVMVAVLDVPTVPVIAVVGEPGPPGPAGPPGPQGPAGEGSAFRYVQSIPATSWLINHLLGVYPNVTVVDTAGDVIVPEIRYIDVNQLELIFSAAVAGEAYLS